MWKEEGGPDEFNESLPRIRQETNYDSDDYYERFDTLFKIGYPLPNLGRVLNSLGHDVTRERLAGGQQVRHRKGRKITDPIYAKRGRYDPDDEDQDESIAPSEVGDDE